MLGGMMMIITTARDSFPKFTHHLLFTMGKKGAYSTWYSQVVTHPGTNQALPSLAAEIRRDRAFSRWYGHKPEATQQIQDTIFRLKHSHITIHSPYNLFRVIQALWNSYSEQRVQANMIFFLERGSPFYQSSRLAMMLFQLLCVYAAYSIDIIVQRLRQRTREPHSLIVPLIASEIDNAKCLWLI